MHVAPSAGGRRQVYDQALAAGGGGPGLVLGTTGKTSYTFTYVQYLYIYIYIYIYICNMHNIKCVYIYMDRYMNVYKQVHMCVLQTIGYRVQ